MRQDSTTNGCEMQQTYEIGGQTAAITLFPRNMFAPTDNVFWVTAWPVPLNDNPPPVLPDKHMHM